MTFKKTLDKYLDNNDVSVNSIIFDKDALAIEIKFELASFVSHESFLKLKNEIKRDLPFINNVQIDKKYAIAIEDKKRFLIKNIREILKGRRKITKSIYVALMNSRLDFKEDQIIFELNDEMIYKKIQRNKLDREIAQILSDEFNLTMDILVEYKRNDSMAQNFDDHKSKEVRSMISDIRKQRKSMKNKPSKKKSSTYKKGSSSIYKGKIKDNPIPIKDIFEEGEYVAIDGQVFQKDSRELRGGKILIMLAVTDKTSSIGVKVFARPKTAEKILSQVNKGEWYSFQGGIRYDKFDKELVMFANKINRSAAPETVERKDTAKQKRVELHLHTNMSEMDGINEAGDFIKRAKKWSHSAIGITDHGVLQAYPDAKKAADENIKVLYGVEGYLFNDNAALVNYPNDSDLNQEFIIFDIETTGLNKKKDMITEIGAIKIRNKQIIDRYSVLVNPEKVIPDKIVELTGITNAMVKEERTIDEVLPEFIEFIGNRPVVAHNATFDMSFIYREAKKLAIDFDPIVLDTLTLARMLVKEKKRHRLSTLARFFKVNLENHHRAIDDAAATALIFIKLLGRLEDKGAYTLNQINELALKEMDYKVHQTYHVIIYAKNKKGLRDLYKLVSKTNLETFYKKPRMPKSLLNSMRDNLIIGSACEAGELYRSILDNKSEEKIESIAKFYDFLEVQPLDNNRFLLENGVLETEEELININKTIIALGEKLNKPVVATGDVHFLEPEDEVYRRILMAGKGFRDADNQPPLYFKTTSEMLEDFSYLSDQKAYEVVVENTNKIADMIDTINPIPDETFPPKIEGSDGDLREMCYSKAKSIYGEPLPKLVEERLEVELKSIIDNGYSVMYIIAQKLVDKSLEDGYLVGSRGSVGSSFAATMSNITEVNPLPPHYVCGECKHSEFIRDGSVGSGVDLPDKNCPNCDIPYIKEGHDIPFEVFLGFGGGKEPDIDLNFAGVYQANAHKYTEVLFGEGHTFKAGTIGTIADKTAFGYVSKYFEEREITIRKKEIERLSGGCTGVKRTTGQHPGGIMVVPNDMEIYDVCPIQYPANDTESDVITTHFDYHSIHDCLLKLDILGHDVPTMIRQLEDITGVDIMEVPLDDQETMGIFTSTDPLDIKDPEYSIKLGSLGIPEFGTSFVRQMLKDTQPTTFSDLVRISGLSHGTDVWLNNAQELVRQGTVKIKDVISTRDDIMNYLIYNGLPNEDSFYIMEDVRKGRGLKEPQEKLMVENDIPKWYIDSCKKIKYMFPKAHAVAYVMMSFRMAYFKVHYPLAFYVTFLTSKVEDFDAEIICKGKESVLNKMKELKAQDRMTKKDQDLYAILEISYEYYARGFEFENVDLYDSHYNEFKIKNNKLLPPLQALDGVGENAAKSVVEARKDGEFISIEDLKNRTKVTKTGVEALKAAKCLGDMPEQNQLSLF